MVQQEKKRMYIGSLERSCVLTMIYKKRPTTEETILDTGIIRVHYNSKGPT